MASSSQNSNLAPAMWNQYDASQIYEDKLQREETRTFYFWEELSNQFNIN